MRRIPFEYWTRLPLGALAGFAAFWILHRAVVQSITLDEADTYIHWVATDWASHWEPHSNNHVLNSTLMRLSIWLFGLGHFAARAPALLGGLVYILSVYRLCRLLDGGRALGVALFLCLVYNPFIMDYLVAARGYGLALGFLSLGMYLLARMNCQADGRAMAWHAAGVSACAGLSICSNFSFGFASGFLLAAAVVAACFQLPKREWLWLAAACAGAVLMVLLVLAGPALTEFPRDQLFWGTDSWRNTWRDIREASFGELNPFLVNPLLAKAFLFFQRRLFKIEAVLLAMYVVLTTASRWPPRNSQARLAGGLAIVLGLTVAAHWMQFKLLKIPLPFERTSVFLVPLLTALTGSILAIAPSNRVERVVRGAGIAGLMFAGVFFVGELRDTYFREWRNGADARAAFPVILELCRKMGVREVTSDWNLSSSFEFYRKLDGVAETAVEFPHFDFDKMPQGRRIYVLQESFYAEFIRREKLKAVWHGTSSDLQVLVRSDGSGL